VGVSTLGYPSGPADPPDSAMTSVTDTLTTAESTAISTTGSSYTVSSRQPPTVTADTTAAAFQSPTLQAIGANSPRRQMPGLVFFGSQTVCIHMHAHTAGHCSLLGLNTQEQVTVRGLLE